MKKPPECSLIGKSLNIAHTNICSLLNFHFDGPAAGSCKTALISFSQFDHAIPVPKPAPRIIGQRLRLKNNRENTEPSTIPPPN